MFESPLDPQADWPGRYINVRCGGLSMVLLQLKDPLELLVKSSIGNFFPVLGFYLIVI